MFRERGLFQLCPSIFEYLTSAEEEDDSNCDDVTGGEGFAS